MKLYSANKLTIGLLTAITLTACEKEPQYLSRTNDRQQSVLYIQQATTFPNTLTTFPFTSSARTFNFNVGLGSLGYLNSSVTVKMQIDMAAFDSINAIRSAAGQPLYEKFPADAYQLSATEATIQAGALKSNTVTLSYISDKFNAAKSYLLPISIKDSDGCKVNKTLQTLFVEVAKLEGRLVPAATKQQWDIAASSEELIGEGSVNGRAKVAIDGDITTFWHSTWATTNPPFPHWLAIDMKQAYFVDKISMAPRQGNPNGFIRFTLEGSLDGVNYTKIAEDLVFDPTKNDGSFQEFPFAVREMRFIKINMLQPRVSINSTHLAEINVYRF